MSKGELNTLPGEAIDTIDRPIADSKYASSEYWPIGKLKPWDRNPRSIKQDRFKELKARLSRQGQIKPLLVTKDGTVIGGNMRLRAFTELGWREVWVSVTDAQTDKDIFDLALTDNEEFGYYEQEQLAELALSIGLSPLELESYEVQLGESKPLSLLIDELSPEEVVEDEAPEVDESEPPKSKLGEVYQLGRHRLMCGSSTDIDNVKTLFNDTKPHIVMTDPPYGIDVVTGTADGSKAFGSVGAKNVVEANRYSAIIGDDTTDTARDFYSTCVSMELSNYVIWGGNYFTDFLPPQKCWLVWDKKGRQWDDNFSDFEMAWTSYDKPAKIFTHVWMGMVQGGEREARVHPTQKPAQLIAEIIKYLEAPKDKIVYDGFGGSGSTLIACEQTDRICYMMELDPKYVDVIRKRYAKFVNPESWEDEWQEMTPVVKEVAYA